MAGTLHKVQFLADELDYNAIHHAVALKQATCRINGNLIVPDFQGSLLACVLAEICRDWEEYREKWSRRTESDGEA